MDKFSSKKNKRLFKNIIIIGVGTVFARLISFVMTPFFSSWLSTSDYGEYDLIATYISLCVPLVTLQLDQGIYRFTIENKDNSSYYYRIVVKFMICSAFLSSVLVFLFLNYLGFSFSIISCFLLYYLSLSFYNIMAEHLRGKDNLIAYSSLSISTGVLTILLSVVFVKYMRLGVEGLLLVFGLAYFITFVISQLIYKPYKEVNKDDINIAELLRYSIPLIPNNISWWITNVSDRTLITFICGSFYNGIYAICCKIPTMLSIVFSIFNLSFQQVALEGATAQEQKEYFNYLIKNVIEVLFTGSIFIVSITPLLYIFFLKPDYFEGVNCVPVLLCGAIFLSLAQYLGDILLLKKETKLIGLSTIVAACANIILNFELIPLLGIMGASIATLVSYIIMFSFRLYANREIIEVNMIMNYLLLFMCFYMLFCFVVVKFSKNIPVIIVLTLLSGVILIISNRKMMYKIFSKIVRNRRK